MLNILKDLFAPDPLYADTPQQVAKLEQLRARPPAFLMCKECGCAGPAALFHTAQEAYAGKIGSVDIGYWHQMSGGGTNLSGGFSFGGFGSGRAQGQIEGPGASKYRPPDRKDLNSSIGIALFGISVLVGGIWSSISLVGSRDWIGAVVLGCLALVVGLPALFLGWKTLETFQAVYSLDCAKWRTDRVCPRCGHRNAQCMFMLWEDACLVYEAEAKNNPHFIERFQELERQLADARDPQTKAEAYITRGGLLNALGDNAKALSDATEAARLVPNHWRPYWLGGWIKEAMGRWDDAIADYEKAVPPANEDTVFLGFRYAAMSGIARCSARKGDFTRARTIITTEFSRAPSSTYEYEHRQKDWQKVVWLVDFWETLAKGPGASPSHRH